MALTKHEKLARGIKTLLRNLDAHFKKVADCLNVVQFHFSELYLIPGRPLMAESTLAAMMRIYVCGIQCLSSNAELRFMCLVSTTYLFRRYSYLSHFSHPHRSK